MSAEDSLVDRLGNEAAYFLRRRFEEEGIEAYDIIVLSHALSGVPEGENASGCSAVGQFDTPAEMFELLLRHVTQIAEAMGITVHLGGIPPGAQRPELN